MLALMKVFVDIVLRRKGPQDLPASTLLLVLATAAYLGLSVAMLATRHALLPNAPEAKPGPQLHHAFIEPALTLTWIWLLLALFRRPDRFRQSATAVMGVGLVIYPILLGASLAAERVGKASLLFWPLWVVLLVVSVWYVLAIAHILRNALETPLFSAIVLTLLYMLTLLMIEMRLFGVSS